MTKASLSVRKSLWVLLLLAVSVSATAQKGKTKPKEKPKEKVPVFNYVIDDPMDVFGRQPVPADIVQEVLLPEFCSRGDKPIKDTVLVYECYNAANSLLNPDTLYDYSLLRYVSVTQSYPDPVQIYKAADGTIKPLPVQKIIYRYDKTGNDKWFSVNYITNKSAQLREYTSDIVRRDSITVQDPIKGNYLITVYKYFRVSPMQ
ncbi:MAG: hypothetical protein K9G49_02460 [Taibaiella sp.]|nr:hypothetical protein [Taibaiella sp.]